MKSFRKLLALGVATTAIAAIASPANALVSTNAVVPFITSGTTPATLTFGTTTVTVTNEDIVGIQGTGAFTALFAPSISIVFTLSQGTFSVAPTCTVNAGTAATLTAGGAGAASATCTLGAGSTATSLTLGNIVTVPTSVATSASVSVSVSSPNVTTTSVPAAFLTTKIATFGNAIKTTTNRNNPTLNANGTLNAVNTADTASLGDVSYQSNGRVLYDGTTALTFGAPVVTATIPYNTNSLTAATFTNVAGGCWSADSPATLPLSTNLVPSAANGTANALTTACQIGLTLTDTAADATHALVAQGASSLTATFPITNGPVGNTSQAIVAALGTPVTAAGGSTTSFTYANGDDAAFGWYLSVTTTGASSIRVNSGSFSADLVASQGAGTTALYSIADIRAALVAVGASTGLWVNSGARAPLNVLTSSAGVLLNGFILNKSSNMVTTVGRNIRGDS